MRLLTRHLSDDKTTQHVYNTYLIELFLIEVLYRVQRVVKPGSQQKRDVTRDVRSSDCRWEDENKNAINKIYARLAAVARVDLWDARIAFAIDRECTGNCTYALMATLGTQRYILPQWYMTTDVVHHPTTQKLAEKRQRAKERRRVHPF